MGRDAGKLWDAMRVCCVLIEVITMHVDTLWKASSPREFLVNVSKVT